MSTALNAISYHNTRSTIIYSVNIRYRTCAWYRTQTILGFPRLKNMSFSDLFRIVFDRFSDRLVNVFQWYYVTLLT